MHIPEVVARCDDVKQAEDILASKRGEAAANRVLSRFFLSLSQTTPAPYSDCMIDGATRVAHGAEAQSDVLGADQKLLDTNVAITSQSEAVVFLKNSQSGAGRDVLGAVKWYN